MTDRAGEERVQECQNNWRDGTCPKCGEAHYIVVRRQEFEHLRTRLRAVEGEAKKAYDHMDAAAERYEREAEMLEAKLTAAEQRVAVAHDAIRRLCSGDYSANDVADWLALTRLTPPPPVEKENANG